MSLGILSSNAPSLSFRNLRLRGYAIRDLDAEHCLLGDSIGASGARECAPCRAGEYCRNTTTVSALNLYESATCQPDCASTCDGCCIESAGGWECDPYGSQTEDRCGGLANVCRPCDAGEVCLEGDCRPEVRCEGWLDRLGDDPTVGCYQVVDVIADPDLYIRDGGRPMHISNLQADEILIPETGDSLRGDRATIYECDGGCWDGRGNCVESADQADDSCGFDGNTCRTCPPMTSCTDGVCLMDEVLVCNGIGLGPTSDTIYGCISAESGEPFESFEYLCLDGYCLAGSRCETVASHVAIGRCPVNQGQCFRTLNVYETCTDQGPANACYAEGVRIGACVDPDTQECVLAADQDGTRCGRLAGQCLERQFCFEGVGFNCDVRTTCHDGCCESEDFDIIGEECVEMADIPACLGDNTGFPSFIDHGTSDRHGREWRPSGSSPLFGRNQCGPSNCRNGCCFDGECLEFGTQTDETCGRFGQGCNSCDPGNVCDGEGFCQPRDCLPTECYDPESEISIPFSSQNVTTCGAEGRICEDCASRFPGHAEGACVSGICVDLDGCDGCVVTESVSGTTSGRTRCLPAESQSAARCGADREACVACEPGESCVAGECVAP